MRRKDGPNGFRPGRLRALLVDPSVEGLELIRLKANADQLARLSGTFAFRVITSCSRHAVVITPLRAEGKLALPPRP